MAKKDDEQDKEINLLKNQLKTVMSKYLKKRKKETKDKKKYSKIKSTIQKKGQRATSKGDIAKLIALLKQGIMTGGKTGATTVQPVIQQTPATTGSIADRVSKDKKKTVGDPLKLWREVKKNWENVKDKYNNNTLTRDDLVNIYKKAKELAVAVSDNTLLAIASITTMYGIGKRAYEYLRDFINKHRPLTETALSTETTTTTPTPPPTPPTPPPTDSDSGSGGGGGAPTTEPDLNFDAPVQMRGQGLGGVSNARARDTPDTPETGTRSESWSEYLTKRLPSIDSDVMERMGLPSDPINLKPSETTVNVGVAGLGLGVMAGRMLGRLRGGRLGQRLAQREGREEMARDAVVARGGAGLTGEALQAYRQSMATIDNAMGGLEQGLDALINQRRQPLRARQREEGIRGKFGQQLDTAQAGAEPAPVSRTDLEVLQSRFDRLQMGDMEMVSDFFGKSPEEVKMAVAERGPSLPPAEREAVSSMITSRLEDLDEQRRITRKMTTDAKEADVAEREADQDTGGFGLPPNVNDPPQETSTWGGF